MFHEYTAMNDDLYVMYTGHYEREGKRREVQCIAVSQDGIQFEKSPNNPVIDERQLGKHGDIAEFRDPKVFEKNGMYYTVIASKKKDNRGEILLFESLNMLDWSFKSVLLEGTKEQGVMWECPDLFELDGKDVLIIMSPIDMSPQGHAYHNTSSTAAFIGDVNWETGHFSVDNYHEIDTGLDFYAPQTCEGPGKERVMVAWMQMWHRTIWSHELGHGWSGAMTLPRQLNVVNNELIQRPIQGFYDALTELNKQTSLEILKGEALVDDIDGANYIKVDIGNIDNGNSWSAYLYGKEIILNYHGDKKELSLSREQGSYDIKGQEASQLVERTIQLSENLSDLMLEIVLDRSSIEVFVNQRQSMTMTFYSREASKTIRIESDTFIKINELVYSTIK